MPLVTSVKYHRAESGQNLLSTTRFSAGIDRTDSQAPHLLLSSLSVIIGQDFVGAGWSHNFVTCNLHGARRFSFVWVQPLNSWQLVKRSCRAVRDVIYSTRRPLLSRPCRNGFRSRSVSRADPVNCWNLSNWDFTSPVWNSILLWMYNITTVNRPPYIYLNVLEYSEVQRLRIFGVGGWSREIPRGLFV